MSEMRNFTYKPKLLVILVGAILFGFGTYFFFQKMVLEQLYSAKFYLYAVQFIFSAIFALFSLLAVYLTLLAFVSPSFVKISEKSVSVPEKLFKLKPVTIYFSDIEKVIRVKTYGKKQDTLKLVHPGGKLIIQKLLCRNFEEFDEIVSLITKGTHLARKRILVNGTQDNVEIYSKTGDYHKPQWWADLFHIIRNQSKGDRSMLIGLYQIIDKGDTPIIASLKVSEDNNVLNSEIWERLMHLGYLKEDTEREYPDELKGIMVHYNMTEVGKKAMLWLFLASNVRDEGMTENTEPIADFAKGFQSLQTLHDSMSVNQLIAIREAFFSGREIIAKPDKNQDLVLKIYTDFGALNFMPGYKKKWKATLLGKLVAPFIMDSIIFERERDENSDLQSSPTIH